MRIKSLMTPPEILARKDFEKPLIIHPEKITTFEELLTVRDEIRNLQLVPVKDDEMYLHYKTVDKDALLEEIKQVFRMSSVSVFVQPNKFPYWLPKDIEQRLVWVAPGTNDFEVVDHISDIVEAERHGDNVILFERPLGLDVKLVRGTFPQMRHIHFWTKKK
jgi:hypothetical protein